MSSGIRRESHKPDVSLTGGESPMSEERETPASLGLRRELAKWAFWGTIIAALIGATSAIAAAWITIIPQLPTPEQIYHTDVSASIYPFADTNVSIEKGDVVQVIVEGDDAHWNCGTGDTSAEGFFDQRWRGHVVPSANLCELVGYVREGVFLRIGAYEQFEATESGSLHLGANDDPNQIGDNSGTLQVKIIVTR
jgi:hypothetical protein